MAQTPFKRGRPHTLPPHGSITLRLPVEQIAWLMACSMENFSNMSVEARRVFADAMRSGNTGAAS
ncbi:hypothetical protein NKH37_11255 [Mesorhizobium sp. M1217]|uniref:hypothetical protein n=1 Tax=Mesorhizobium sp. M1217 TaxID=2957070 RepID=UPI0033388C8E